MDQISRRRVSTLKTARNSASPLALRLCDIFPQVEFSVFNPQHGIIYKGVILSVPQFLDFAATTPRLGIHVQLENGDHATLALDELGIVPCVKDGTTYWSHSFTVLTANEDRLPKATEDTSRPADS